MASANVIAELLRLDEQEKARQRGIPGAAANQMFEGLSRGLQLYDAMKSMPYKYGQDIKNPGTPGTPGTSAQIPAPRVEPGIGPKGDPTWPASMQQVFAVPPRVLPGIGPSMPGTQGTQATPPSVTHIPGSLDMDRLVKAASVAGSFSGPGPQNLMQTVLQQSGMGNLGAFEPALKSFLNTTTGELITAPKGTSQILNPTVPVLTPTAAVEKGSVPRGTMIVDPEKAARNAAAQQAEIDNKKVGIVKNALDMTYQQILKEGALETALTGIKDKGMIQKRFQQNFNTLIAPSKGLFSKEEIEATIEAQTGVLQQQLGFQKQSMLYNKEELNKTIQIVREAKSTGVYNQSAQLFRKSLLEKYPPEMVEQIEMLSNV